MPALDGIRAIAILAVMGAHVVVELAPGGSIGVDVFFALSGLLITGLLHTELCSSGGSSNGPVKAINGRLEHLRGTALGSRHLTNYIQRFLLDTGSFRPRLQSHLG